MLRLYTKEKCIYCYMLKEKLDTWGVEYDEIDVTSDEETRSWLIERGFTTLPQLMYNGMDVLENNTAALTPVLLIERMGVQGAINESKSI